MNRDKKYVGLVFILFFVLLGGCKTAMHLTRSTVTGTVTANERITEVSDGNSNSYYLVWIDGQPYKNSDSLLEWKFDSSTAHGALEVGEEVTVEVYGWRIPFLSCYKNIAEVK